MKRHQCSDPLFFLDYWFMQYYNSNTMLHTLKTIWHPEWYHNPAKGPYFEGWYYKQVDKDGKHSFIVIPGIFIEKDKTKSYAFIHIFKKGQSPHFVTYPFHEFTATYTPFSISIAGNHFTLNTITLAITSSDISVSGQCSFENRYPWPVKLFSPGSMGWYAFVPTMECNHAVLSMDHSISGAIRYNEELMDFTGGRGYMEKDWGKSFPSAYIWFQTNHFATVGTSIFGSIATIPWKRSYFTGFLIALLHNGRLYTFTTYNNAQCTLSVTDLLVRISCSKGNRNATITIKRTPGIALPAPYNGSMQSKIYESLDAHVHCVFNENNHTVLDDTGSHAGFEIVGDIDNLIAHL